MDLDWQILYSSVIGHASIPEIIWTAEALFALYLRLVNRHRAAMSLKSLPEALKRHLVSARQAADMRAILRRRIESANIHIPIKVVFTVLGVSALLAPDPLNRGVVLQTILGAYGAIVILSLMLLDIVRDETNIRKLQKEKRTNV